MIVRLKVNSCQIEKMVIIMFQFYDSPIKSWRRFRCGCSLLRRFNSMIVRLKALRKLLPRSPARRFNSMIVRLKAYTLEVSVISTVSVSIL